MAAGDGNAALAQNGLIALRELPDIAVHICQHRRLDDAVFLFLIDGKADVVGNGIGEQEVVLGHIGTGPPDIRDLHRIDIVTVNKQCAIGHIVGAQDQVHKCCLAAAGTTYQADVLACMDGKGHIVQRVIISVGIAEGQIPEFDIAPDILQRLHAGSVHHILFGIQKLTDALYGSSAAAGHIDHIRHSHDGPDNGGKIADKLHQLTGVEAAFIPQVTAVHQIAAVAKDNTDHALHKGHDQNTEQNRDLGKFNIGLFVFPVQLLKSPQLLALFDEGLDHRDTGKALLRKIGQVGKGLLPLFPFLAHIVAQHDAGGHQQAHGDQRKACEHGVHPPHFDNGQRPQKGCVKKFHDTPGEALLKSIQIVGIQAHQIAHIVLMVKFLT